MFVDYLHPTFGWWSQYCRHSAGYYRGLSRRFRREAEAAAWAAGARVAPLLPTPAGGVPCGAPGLLGGFATQAALDAARSRAYPAPGSLP